MISSFTKYSVISRVTLGNKTSCKLEHFIFCVYWCNQEAEDCTNNVHLCLRKCFVAFGTCALCHNVNQSIPLFIKQLKACWWNGSYKKFAYENFLVSHKNVAIHCTCRWDFSVTFPFVCYDLRWMVPVFRTREVWWRLRMSRARFVCKI